MLGHAHSSEGSLRNRSRLLPIYGLGLLALLVLACSDPERPMREFSVAEAVEGAASLAVRVEMPGGLLDVGPGSEPGVAASFRHDHDKMVPRVDAVLDGSVGRVVVTVPGYEEGLGRTRNEWRLWLDGTRPQEIDVRLGTGMLRFVGGDVDLSRLDVMIAQGICDLDLAAGAWRRDASVVVDVGTGEARITVPTDVGVRLRCKEAVGDVEVVGLSEERGAEDSWVNDAFGKSPVTLELSVRVGWGVTTVTTQRTPANGGPGGG